MNIQENPLYLKFSQKMHAEDFEFLKQLLNSYELDLAPEHGYFNETDFNLISQKAIYDFFKKINVYDMSVIDAEDIRFLWTEVLSDFRKKYWGYTKYQEKPTNYRNPQKGNLALLPQSEIPKRPAKKVSYKDSFFYIWSVLQALIITKALILVFGNALAKDDTVQNRIIFGAVLLFSFGSLFVFAWLRRKKPK